ARNIVAPLPDAKQSRWSVGAGQRLIFRAVAAAVGLGVPAYPPRPPQTTRRQPSSTGSFFTSYSSSARARILPGWRWTPRRAPAWGGNSWGGGFTRPPEPDKPLRNPVLYPPGGGAAHVHFDRAVADLPREPRGRTVPPVPHSPWRLLEHMRIAQWDILEFSR